MSLIEIEDKIKDCCKRHITNEASCASVTVDFFVSLDKYLLGSKPSLNNVSLEQCP